MALKQKSLFLYGYTVTAANQNLDFRSVALETPRQAVLNLGYYSLSGLMREIVRAMEAVDNTNLFTVTADRTYAAGLENRITITTSGSHLELLFASGPNAATTCASLIGFSGADQTGSTSYTGAFTTGTALQPNPGQSGIFGYNYQSPDSQPKVTGNLNIAASGVKEAVVFNIQKFWNVEFKYISSAEFASGWSDLINWMIQARPLEFTPEVTTPTTFFEGTLESASGDSKGLGFLLKEMLPDFPDLYTTGPMKFRQRLS